MALTMAEIRHSRSSYQGAVTRSIRANKDIVTDNPAIYDLKSLSDKLQSLECTERKCNEVQDRILGEEQDMTKLSKDEEAGDNFERTMGTAKSIISKLIALKLAHELAIEICERLESLKSHNPTADHTVVLNSFSVTLEDLRKLSVTLPLFLNTS